MIMRRFFTQYRLPLIDIDLLSKIFEERIFTFLRFTFGRLPCDKEIVL